jgi:integrase
MSLEKTRHPAIYRRGEKYVAVVSYKDGAGEYRQKWITKATLAAAKDARRDFLNQLDRGLQPSDGRMPLATYLEEWLGECLTPKGLRPRPLTLQTYAYTIRVHILPTIGGVRLVDLDRHRLRALYNDLDPMTAMRVHRVLSSSLSWAVKERGLLAANPCASVRRPRPPQKEARWMEEQDARRMLEAARGSILEGAVILGLAAGLRVAEACGVRWGDLDLSTGVLTVGRSWWGETKSGKTRQLTVPASQVEALRRVKREEAERLLALGIRQEDATPIVTDALGRQMPPRTFSEFFKRFVGEYGFEATFHTLRHTCAALLLAAGTDVKTVSERMGHDPAVLLRVYAHAIKSADKAAAERLDGVLGL